jgi:hypothetical protein
MYSHVYNKYRKSTKDTYTHFCVDMSKASFAVSLSVILEPDNIKITITFIVSCLVLGTFFLYNALELAGKSYE